MSRVKTGTVRRTKHKKILASTKGYRGAKHRLLKSAKEAALHAGEYAFSGRKQKKRQKRRLWITQINNLLSEKGLSYNIFINNLNKAEIQIDRKILSDLASNDPQVFDQILQKTTK